MDFLASWSPIIIIALAFGLCTIIAHYRGQVAMKAKVRRQINEHIDSGDIQIAFRDGQQISSEQLLQFICYGQEPDTTDASKSVDDYKPR